MTSATGQQRGWAVPLAVLIVGSFMSVLDTSIVNVAIPKIQIELGASAGDVEWVVTGYTLALGVVVPLSGWLGMRIGQTTLYNLALAGFAVASGLCGLAWNLDTLIGFRILQAIPGGLLPVVTMTLLYRIVPTDKIGTAMGMYGLGVVFAPAVGPTLGGWLVQYIDWRLIFYINVPIGILGTVAALAVFPRVHPTSWPKFDALGFVTVAYGLFALLLAFSKGQDWGWTGYRIEMLLVSGLLSLALFVVIELESDNPLIDMAVLKNWPFVNSLLLIAVTTAGMFTALYYIPQFLQVVQGMQALDAGLVLMPSALIMVVLMPLAGRLYDRIGARWPAVIGLLIMAYGSLLLSQMTVDTTKESLIVWTSIRNVGTGLAMMPIMTSGISALSNSLTSSGSAMNNVMQRVSSSIAVAVFGGMVASQQAQLMSDRGSLLRTGAQALPELDAAQQQGPNGVLGIYQHLQQMVVTTSYANTFLAIAMLCAIAAALALLLRSGAPKAPAAPAADAPTTTPAAAPIAAAAPAVAPTAAAPPAAAPPAVEPEPAPEPERVSEPILVAPTAELPRWHLETPAEREARRNEEAAKAMSGVHV
ncbi:DHA2 family efflux MFS transporter permease subunit [Pseudonocardia spinosispora]|uniref:DHA2 family efflux MFS transporter permease subunit n=1 Tax=Pseudonocardia spinosispora TaxID=103441 RepID=UPI0012EB8FC1|nr:DHA2 family efflux MFS transporter permease subunit [Pseudonocardia spinosispora]